MEQLLSTSFDLLSSYDTNQIRKGMRCLEGFFVKMCILTPPPLPARNGARPTPQPANTARPRDVAAREFMRLQNGFEYNGSAVATKPTEPS